MYQVGCFAILFLASRYALEYFTQLSGIWLPLTAFAIGTLLSPQFKAVNSPQGTRLFMTWIFMKGVRELK